MEIEGARRSGQIAARSGADVEARLLQHLHQAGYTRVEPPILQDAAIFLDLGGEEIRASLYLTGDGSGTELCLRPEYTIPACRTYLETDHDGSPAAFCYAGPVFRQQAHDGGESRQAGLETFGRTDIAAADAETLAVALAAAASAGAPDFAITMGDAGLMTAFLDVLDLPPLWQRRLRRGLERGQSLDEILAGAPSPGRDRAGGAGALTGANGSDAQALIEDLLSAAGIAAVGGRSVGEIAERFLAQVAQQSSAGFGAERRAMLTRFLAISGDLDRVSAELRRLARDAPADLGASLDLFDERTGFIAAQEIDLATITFRTAFARSLDYYTGFVFEARAADGPGSGVLVGGGRYDRLAQALGSAGPIPAVGAAIWIDRLAEGRGR